MSGFGAAPLGTAPYGLGTPATSSSNSGVLLPDASGATQGSRFLNARTRRYEYGPDGRARGQESVSSLVQMALLTVKGTSAMASLGDEAPSGVIGNNFVARRKASITQALSALTTANTIEIVSLDVLADNRPILTIVRWRDLTTTLEQETTI